MSELLVTQSEKFLKEIQHKPIIAESIEDFDSFIEIYSYLKNNLNKLQDLRNKMEIRGFTSPYSALKRYGKGNSNQEIIPDDVYDQSRHAQYFRIKASNKKNILDQVKSAIASHKIAIGHLEEYAEITCKQCGQEYKTNTLESILNYDENFEVTNYECTCGSHEFIFNPNSNGIYRLDMIKYLPLGGEYLLKRSQLNNYSLEAYRKIIKVMKQEKRGRVKSITVIAKIKDERTGKWKSKKMNIDYADESNYELELRKRYGPNVRIELLQFHYKKPSLINDKYVQNALAIAYLQYSENIVNKKLDDIIPKHIHNMDKIKTYDRLVEEARKDANRLARGAEERMDLEEDLKYIKLKKANLINENHELDRELKSDLNRQSEIKRHYYIETPHTLIRWDIFKYYLTTSENRRNNYSGPFPNLRPTLDYNQMKVFDDEFPRDVVQILQDDGENIDVIPNMRDVIQYNSELETKRKNLHLKSNHAAYGAVALNSKTTLSLNRAADLLYVDKKEATDAKKTLQKIEKPSTKKAKKFLDIINK
ncbi:DUF530 domain-containing protein [Candidatus Methanosphaera massiliense]|jgi:Zn-finger domain-containing protein|uniref:DUF530 domain-containing protein n=1 Tax=Methanosphaera TaxID=2316 RepID=UPI0023806301|nr:DUF530 domain-containing protein [Candidatus Methanosphaera massiliense]MDD6285724.1 DUF530 domain-containing protein [Methanobacteriaceae archaeon]MDE4078040.1 DUF530 domain-containing protein [Candidatus Methanosphaera massiliense]MDY2745005.1 DUF530 domain-containing protein [Methanosphaera sp.]